MPEELERAVALARDRAGEELERETPPKLSKEGGVKTGGPVEGRKGGKIVEINEKMLPEIGKPGEHSYTTAGKKDGPGKIKKGKATTKEQPAARTATEAAEEEHLATSQETEPKQEAIEPGAMEGVVMTFIKQEVVESVIDPEEASSGGGEVEEPCRQGGEEDGTCPGGAPHATPAELLPGTTVIARRSVEVEEPWRQGVLEEVGEEGCKVRFHCGRGGVQREVVALGDLALEAVGRVRGVVCC